MNTTFITRYFISSIVLLSLIACGIPTTNTADNRQQIIQTNPENKKDDSSIVTKFAEKETNDIRLEHETAVAPERHKTRTDTRTKSFG